MQMIHRKLTSIFIATANKLSGRFVSCCWKIYTVNRADLDLVLIDLIILRLHSMCDSVHSIIQFRFILDDFFLKSIQKNLNRSTKMKSFSCRNNRFQTFKALSLTMFTFRIYVDSPHCRPYIVERPFCNLQILKFTTNRQCCTQANCCTRDLTRL